MEGAEGGKKMKGREKKRETERGEERERTSAPLSSLYFTRRPRYQQTRNSSFR